MVPPKCPGKGFVLEGKSRRDTVCVTVQSGQMPAKERQLLTPPWPRLSSSAILPHGLAFHLSASDFLPACKSLLRVVCVCVCLCVRG